MSCCIWPVQLGRVAAGFVKDVIWGSQNARLGQNVQSMLRFKRDMGGLPSFPQKPEDSPVVPCPRGGINRLAAGVSPDLVAPMLVRAPKSEMGVVSLVCFWILDPLYFSGAHTLQGQSS